MSDRELLEAAAKAAGINLDYRHGSDAYYYDDPETGREEWKPLHDDGQALRLAVKLGISISFDHSTRLDVVYPTINQVAAFAGWCPSFFEANQDDWVAATRRAIVRAAAAMSEGGDHE